MVKKLNQLDLSKRYTYADYLTWQFQERVELIKGWIMKMSPAPSTKHQRISNSLSYDFTKFLRKSPCNIFVAPFDVRLLDKSKSISDNKIYTVVQPDISIICDEAKIDERGCIGAPDLIVEIASNANTKHDLERKYKLYEENSVKEYWVVLQNDEVVLVYDLIESKYALRKIYTNEEVVQVGIFKKLKIDLKEIF